jgi:hypothetical protein
MLNLISRITVLAVGVSEYQDALLHRLNGSQRDLNNLRDLLTNNPSTAIYQPTQFIEKINPTTEELHEAINEYIMGRSADGDILIFYFSGHGVSIGRDDFGFCMADTIIHPTTRVTLPLTIVKFSELLSSLNIANVIPIIIIDACYSGIAGKALEIPPIEAIASMHHQLHSFAASSYALLCSCSDTEAAIDTPDGGIFSQCLVDVAIEGLSSTEVNSPILTLSNIYPKLFEKVLGTPNDTTPRLYLGPTLPDFPLIKNTQYKPHRYSLSSTYISVLEALWNNGNERTLSPNEIGDLCSNGAYCNHNKLSFLPWNLVETIPNTRGRRRLTNRGRQFLRNELQVPKVIVEDPVSGEKSPVEGTAYVSYVDF